MSALPPRRASGILLHLSSLPNAHGHGALGPEAYAFVDFLRAAGQRYWQFLPIHPTGPGNSPYSGVSAFAGNPLLISLDLLVTQGLLSASELGRPLASGKLDYTRARRHSAPLLRRAFQRFLRRPRSYAPLLERMRAEARFWLGDYCLFMALRAHAQSSLERGSWTRWDAGLRRRDPSALRAARRALADEVAYYEFEQLMFEQQWRALHAYAAQREVSLIGDIPIFVAHDSADVWAHQRSFQLDARGEPRHVSGVPPDYFSATGQLWGTPLYDWRALARDDYAFWIERFRALLSRFDLVRLDHFIGFVRYWQIPAGALTAQTGRFRSGPGRRLFERARRKLGALPFIAEDLGATTPAVERLRDELGFAGMRILQFGFGNTADNPFLPHNYPADTVAYTGTHDNDTLLGWLEDRASKAELTAARAYLGAERTLAPRQLSDLLIRALFASVAKLAIVPIQDVLGLDNRARMNVPGQAEDNWSFRIRARDLSPRLAQRLATLVRTYGR